jgi:uncharacterized membrane protein YbhN (UPF0104 family)
MKLFKKYGFKVIVLLVFTLSLIALVYRFFYLKESFEFKVIINSEVKVVFLLLAFVFMFINWSIEAIKWKFVNKYVEPINFKKAYIGVLSGISISLLFPNRTGEFVGKIMVLKKDNRFKGIFSSLVSSLSQLFVTLVAGTLGLYFLKIKNIEIISNYHQYLSLFLLVVTIFLYFFFPFIVKKYSEFFSQKIRLIISFLGRFSLNELLMLFIFSLMRYFVFIIQMYLLFISFDVKLNVLYFITCATTSFLLTTIIPTTSFTELFVRNQIGLMIFDSIVNRTELIVFVFTTLWLINIAIPAIIGLLCILKIKN